MNDNTYSSIEELRLTVPNLYNYKIVYLNDNTRNTFEVDDYFTAYEFVQNLRRKISRKQIKTYYHGMETNL